MTLHSALLSCCFVRNLVINNKDNVDKSLIDKLGKIFLSRKQNSLIVTEIVIELV